jgi:hypothetical protein
MLIPKFKIDASDRLYVDEKNISNGHWLLRRQYMSLPQIPKAFKAVENIKNGTYAMGLRGGWDRPGTPDMERILPSNMDGYKKLNPIPQGVMFHNENWVQGYRYETEDKSLSVFVATQYVPLMQLGECFAKEEKAPIIIQACGETAAVIMPLREPK